MPLNTTYPTPVACIYDPHSVKVSAVSTGDWPNSIPDVLFLSYSSDGGTTWTPKASFVVGESKIVDIGETLEAGFKLRFEMPYMFGLEGNCYWGVIADVEGVVPSGYHLEYAWSGDATGTNRSSDLPYSAESPIDYTATCVVTLVPDGGGDPDCTATDTWSDTLECPGTFGAVDYDTVDFGNSATISDECADSAFLLAFLSNNHFCPGETSSLYSSEELYALKYFAVGDQYAMASPLASPALTSKTHDVAEWADTLPYAYTFPIPDIAPGSYFIVGFTHNNTTYPVSSPISVSISDNCDGGGGGGTGGGDGGTDDGDPTTPIISLRRVVRVEQPSEWPETAPCLLPEYRIKQRTEGAVWGDWISARNPAGGLAIMRQDCGPISFDVLSCDIPPYADLQTRLVESNCEDECDEFTAISGSEVVPAIAIDQETEITVNHSVQGTFSFCEYPRVTAPVGIRFTVLAARSNGDSTNSTRFCLLIENISWSPDDYHPDIDLGWTRIGKV